MEKSLIEACLEVIKTDHIIGLQDLGAAGLTSASVEAASNGASGIEIDVGLVPRRETGMTPYEVMLSESQERMLVVVKPGHEDAVKAIFDKWDLQSTVIGKATDDGLARIIDSGGDGALLQGAPLVSTLTDAPQYRLQGVKAKWLTELQERDLSELPLPKQSPEDVLLGLLASPNIASKEWVYRQYDHQVQTNTVAAPGADAAVLRVKGTSEGHCAIDGRQWQALLSRSVHRGHDRGGGSMPQCVLHRRRADSTHRLPELRKPGEAGNILPA